MNQCLASLNTVEWGFLGLYFVIVLAIGLYFVRRSSKNTDSYFLAGRSLPWWLAGTSMAATMFAADTPLFHSGNVRHFGIDAGWLFFAPGFGIILASVLFARLWRRLRVMTEIELFELRYTGRAATIFRCFNAVYGGVFIAALTMGWVTMGMAIVVESLLGIDKVVGTSIFIGIVVIYSASSGIWGVVATDFLQYFVATFGTIYLAIAAIVKCGGFHAMSQKLAAMSQWSGHSLNVWPDPSGWNPNYSWWIVVGYAVVYSIQVSVAGTFLGQKVYAAKDEHNASHSVLWFGFCYYVLNGWPWIITGLASLVILGATNEAAGMKDFQETYPAMILKLMPVGMRGVMAAALIAAFMSTMATLINWGSSYMVNDFYQRFLVKNRSSRHYVWVSRAFSLGLAAFGGWFAFQFENITEMLLKVPLYMIGGVLVWIFRWVWSRTNIWSEISAMFGSIFVAVFVDIVLPRYFGIWDSPDSWQYFGQKILTILAGTTLIWLAVTFLTKPVDDETLKRFYRRVILPGPGWSRIRKLCGTDCPKADSMWRVFFTWLAGVLGLYGFLFAIGYIVVWRWPIAIILLVISAVSTAAYFKLFYSLTHYDNQQLELREEEKKCSAVQK
jgi:SSS family solute:Na+ symporter